MSRVSGALSGLTTRGRCLLAAGVTLTLCALVLGQRDLLRVGALLVALPLAALWIVSRTSYRLSCDRHLDPPAVPAGRPTAVRLRLQNVSRLTSGTLLMEDALPYTLGGRPRFVLHRVEPRGVRDVSYPVTSDARGRFTVGPLSVQLTDPFGLVQLARAFAAVDELVVTPVVVPLPPVRLAGEWSGGELSARSLATSGTDDATTREYRHGDDLRKVHWRSTARTGELMVRREEQPFQSRCTLLLDRRALAHRGEGPQASFEWSVSAVASIGADVVAAGYALSVLDESGAALTPVGTPVSEALLLGALATVQTTRARDLDGALLRLRDGVGGLTVAVLGALDLPTAERLSGLRTSNGAYLALLLDTDSWAPVSARLRAEALARHEQAALLLGGAGWRVIPVERGSALAELWAGASASRPVPAGAR